MREAFTTGEQQIIDTAIEDANTRGGRIVVGGAPRAGKSTYAPAARHTDDLIGQGWSEASEQAAQWMLEPGPWMIEGVATARALRKALDMTADAPCELLLWFQRPFVELSTHQRSMAKGCDTVLSKIRRDLAARGVAIVIV